MGICGEVELAELGKVQGAERYRVYRKDGTLWKRLSDVTGVTYTDKNVISGESYTYTVRCYYSGGKSGYDKKGTTVQYFAAPQLTSAVNKNDGILVRWKSVGGIHKYYPLACHRRKPTALGRWEEPCKFVAINPGSQCTSV